jgi:hypothetical protein
MGHDGVYLKKFNLEGSMHRTLVSLLMGSVVLTVLLFLPLAIAMADVTAPP